MRETMTPKTPCESLKQGGEFLNLTVLHFYLYHWHSQYMPVNKVIITNAYNNFNPISVHCKCVILIFLYIEIIAVAWGMAISQDCSSIEHPPSTAYTMQM